MRGSTRIAALFVIVLSASLVLISPTAALTVGNDAFADAFELPTAAVTDGGRTYTIQTQGQNDDATMDLGETPGILANSTIDASVWWRWTAPSSIGKATVDTIGSNFDTVLDVFIGDDVTDLTHINGNDDASVDELQSRTFFYPEAGVTYFVRVAGYAGGNFPEGSISLRLVWDPVELVGTPSSGASPNDSHLQIEFGSAIGPMNSDASVAYFSANADTVLGGDNTETRAFRRDVAGHTTTALDADDRYVIAMTIDGAWLVTENGSGDLYRVDPMGADRTLITVNSFGGLSTCCATSAAISDDGNVVAFASFATHVTDDSPTTQKGHIYVRDIEAGTTTWVTSNARHRASSNVDISADGRYVVFDSITGEGHDVFIHDTEELTTDSIKRSDATDGIVPRISDDGSTVVFVNLEETDGVLGMQVYAYDVSSRSLSLVSVDPLTDEPLDGFAANPTVSADGRYVAWYSAPNDITQVISDGELYVADRLVGTLRLVDDSANTSLRLNSAIREPVQPFNAPQLSPDGRTLLYSDVRDGYPALVVADLGLPDAPTNVEARQVGPGEVEVTWTPPPPGIFDPGQVLPVFLVDETGPVTETAAAFTFTDLPAGVNAFTIWHRNPVGDGPAAPTVTVDVLAPPGPVAGLIATPSLDSLAVSWTAPLDPVDGYEVRVTPADGSVVVDGTTASVTGLQSGTAYEVTVTARNVAGPGSSTSIQATTQTPVAPSRVGYWMVDAAGNIYPFGDSAEFAAITGTAPSVAIQSSPDGGSLWVLTSDGVVHTRGDATHFGNVDLAALDAGETPAALSVLADGTGYWVFTDRGRALAFGTAPHLGDMSAAVLNGPIVASVATPDGAGYYMIGTDGGVFSFGTASFQGSMGGIDLNQPVVGIAPDPDGIGYWLVAADGGIFGFEADFAGSMGSATLNQPVIGAIAYGDAYLLVAADGGIFNFSTQPFLGSLGDNPPPDPVTGVTAFTN